MKEESFIRELTKIPGVDAKRAMALYDAGYTEVEHFREAIITDLNIVPAINPTVARRIILYFQKEYVPKDDIIMVDRKSETEPYRTTKIEQESGETEDKEGFLKINKKIIGVWTIRYFLIGAFYIWLTIGLVGLMMMIIIGPILVFISVGLTFVMIIIALGYATALYGSFRYRFEVKYISVERGVFFKRKSVIPYDRIQNVNVIQGTLERMYGLKSVEIETAGGSRMVAAGMPALMFSVAEGMIPGVTDPERLSREILSRKERYDSGL